MNAQKRAFNRPATGEIRMSGPDDWKKTVRLNKLLGMRAAEKLDVLSAFLTQIKLSTGLE
jgi:hypothetical protein